MIIKNIFQMTLCMLWTLRDGIGPSIGKAGKSYKQIKGKKEVLTEVSTV